MIHDAQLILAVGAVLVAGLAAAGLATRFRLPALVLLRSREFCSRLAGSMMAMREPSDAPGNVARDSGSNLLMVGRRGTDFVARTLLGSLSQRVVHNVSCDVLVVA